ncbi:IS701 family transposase [Streptomyces sp. NPDC050418]|uniref:IS701 family transposase n=1 Tax=Streptomyces sp. NPDC050418 TaxID=3365612 RepID=UPI00378A2D76
MNATVHSHRAAPATWSQRPERPRRPHPVDIVAEGGPDTAPDTVAELAAALFPEVLRRSDQRTRAEQYVRGLLAAEGRKSIRNIARSVAGSTAEQRLHHFISDSTWPWLPLREALARRLDMSLAPQAWVLQSLPIAKAGDHSVGVSRRFVPQLGQVASGQHAFGVWLASEGFSAPVNWRLHLPDNWVHNREKRRRADIPDSVGVESLEQCAAASVLETMLRWRIPRRPVVLGPCAGADIRWAVQRFASRGVPFLLRVGGNAGLAVADPRLPGYGAGRLCAKEIIESIKALRRPAAWVDHDAGGAPRTSLVVGAPVALPGPGDSKPPTGQAPGLLLLGEWHDPHGPLSDLWLIGMESTPLPALLRLTKLTRRVARDFTEVGEDVGLQDFEGRSFSGWHRHITLASVAHAARMLEHPGHSGDFTAGPPSGPQSGPGPLGYDTGVRRRASAGYSMGALA